VDLNIADSAEQVDYMAVFPDHFFPGLRDYPLPDSEGPLSIKTLPPPQLSHRIKWHPSVLSICLT